MISVGWVGSGGGEACSDRRQIGSLGETTRHQDLGGFVLDLSQLYGNQDLCGFVLDLSQLHRNQDLCSFFKCRVWWRPGNKLNI